MRVVHVAPFYYPIKGGVETVVQKISEYLASKGNEVYVITYNRDRLKGKNILKEIEQINNVNVIRLPVQFTWSHGSYSNKLLEVIRHIDPDIIHVHVWRHPHVFQLANEKFVKILQPHSPFYPVSQVGLITFIYYKLIDNLFSSVIRKYNIIAITPIEQEILMRKFKVPSTLIPNGVDDVYFEQKTEDKGYLLYIGRISKEKNLLTLLKAYKISGIKNKLILAGPDGGIVKELLSYSKKYQLNVEYKNEVSESEKIELISKCRVFINPSPFEGFGITLLEAEAMGKPTIIVGNGGQTYVAPPNTASLRAENDPYSLAKAITTLVVDDSIYSKLSESARKWAENFRWSKILPRFRVYYEKLLHY
jgi:glycosyltransferase involved in cell wall biosynthesis